MLKLCRDTNAVRSTAVRLLKLYTHRRDRECVLHGQLLEMFCQCFLGTYGKRGKKLTGKQKSGTARSNS